MKKHLFIASLIIGVLALSSCTDTSMSDLIKSKYGIAYNPARQKLSLAPVNASMKFSELEPGRRYVFLNQHQPTAKTTCLLRKILAIDTSQTLTRETDYFLNPGENLELTVDHDYVHDTTYINLVHVEDRETNTFQSRDYTSPDSILQAWGLKEVFTPPAPGK